MNWDLAKTVPESLFAYSFDNDLIIRATVLLPTPAYEARIITSPLDIYPPQYLVEARLDPNYHGAAPDVVVPLPVVGFFGYSDDQKDADVHDADGGHLVRIQPWRIVDWVKSGGGGEIPHPIKETMDSPTLAGSGKLEVTRDTATGYSASFSFDEAFRNAISALRKSEHPNPDVATRVSVVSIKGMMGGFMGLHGMFVTVKRTDFSPRAVPEVAVSRNN